MSGVGKSTLLRELARRGHLTVDTDYDGWVLADGNWDEDRLTQLLHHESTIVVSGTVENQVHFYDQFDAVILITAPLDVLLKRVRQRNERTTRTARRGPTARRYGATS